MLPPVPFPQLFVLWLQMLLVLDLLQLGLGPQELPLLRMPLR
jgi:hypothetical protein